MIPSVVVATVAGIGVALFTPASRVTREQALAKLEAERQRMEGPDAAAVL